MPRTTSPLLSSVIVESLSLTRLLAAKHSGIHNK